MKKLRVGILAATGTVGQRFIQLLANHPWIEVSAVAVGLQYRQQLRRQRGEQFAVDHGAVVLGHQLDVERVVSTRPVDRLDNLRHAAWLVRVPRLAQFL